MTPEPATSGAQTTRRVRFGVRTLFLWTLSVAFGLFVARSSDAENFALDISALSSIALATVVFWMGLGVCNEAITLIQAGRRLPDAQIRRAAYLAAIERTIPAICFLVAILFRDQISYDPELWPEISIEFGWLLLVLIFLAVLAPSAESSASSKRHPILRRFATSLAWLALAGVALLYWSRTCEIYWLSHVTLLKMCWAEGIDLVSSGSEYTTVAQRWGIASIAALIPVLALLWQCSRFVSSGIESKRATATRLIAWSATLLFTVSMAIWLVAVALTKVAPFFPDALVWHPAQVYALVAILLLLIAQIAIAGWRARQPMSDIWHLPVSDRLGRCYHRRLPLQLALTIAFAAPVVPLLPSIANAVDGPEVALLVLFPIALALHAVRTFRRRSAPPQTITVYPAGRSIVALFITWASLIMLTVAAAIAGFGVWLVPWYY